jgi:hypothetical protein
MLHTSPCREKHQVDQQQQQSRWQPTRRQLLWAGATVGLLTIAILVGYRYDITLWNWIKLLIVPAVIAGGGLWFNTQQREREQRIANERAQDEALQAYLDAMDNALLRRPSLAESPDESTFISRELAQARTTTIIARLDAERNRIVTRFLRNLALTRRPINILYEADLADAELAGAFFEDANLTEADLRRANLRGANLRNADLRYAYLTNANLSIASLGDANLSGANLSGANLSGANMINAKGITNVELEQVAESLTDTTMPNGQKYEDWLKSKDREGDGMNVGPS